MAGDHGAGPGGMARIHHLIERLARGLAVLGGLVLLALIGLTCLSVAGRALNGFLNGALAQGLAPDLAEWLLALGIGPVTGDFELVQAGIAFAIFAFLPLCQITGGHAAVDFVTARLPVRLSRGLAAVTEAAFAAVLILIAWRLGAGMLAKMRYGETTFLLQYPVWWGYAASLAAAAVAALAGLWMAVLRLAEAVTGRPHVAAGTEPDH